MHITAKMCNMCIKTGGIHILLLLNCYYVERVLKKKETEASE